MNKATIKRLTMCIWVLTLTILTATAVFAAENNELNNQQDNQSNNEQRIYVSLVDDGNGTLLSTTTSTTVAELFQEYRLSIPQVRPHDTVSHQPDAEIFNNMSITIERGYTIYFKLNYRHYSDTIPYDTVINQRVIDVVRAFIDTCEDDYVIVDEPLLARQVTPEMTIELNHLYEATLSENIEIPYEIDYFHTDKLPEGYNLVLSQGVTGTMFVTSNIRYEAGVEVSSSGITEEVAIAPVNELVAVGTGSLDLPFTNDIAAVYADYISQTGQQTAETAAQDDVVWNIYEGFNQSPGSLLFVPEEEIIPEEPAPEQALPGDAGSTFHVEGNYFYVDGEAYAFTSRFNASVTAYTANYASTGKRPGDKNFGITASGLKAQVGVVAVDPKVIPLFTKLYIEGYGFAVAGDTGRSIKGEDVDLYFDTSAEVRAFGRQRHNVYILADQDFEIAIQK